MELERARYLASDAGRAALAGLPPGLPVADPNRLATALRRLLPAAEAAALAEQLTLRARARRNHGTDRDLLYTAEGLEMMTHPVVAQRRAARLAAFTLPVLDLTAGAGGDLRALADAGAAAVGLDRDPAHALLATANSGLSVARGDAARPPFDLAKAAVLLDPSRRAGGTRRFDPAAFSPRWDVTLEFATSAVAACIKAPPGLEAPNVPTAAEFEAIQLGASMREVSLWFGAGAQPGLRRAVLLPSSTMLDSTEPESPPTPVEPGPFLFDPESCVTRAGLVRQLSYQLGAHVVDPHLAYLTAGEPAFSPLAATFEVLDSLPFSLQRLKERLRAGRWRPDEIRRRAFPVEPDELRRLLGKLEGERVTLLLTTIAGQRTVFICRRLFPAA